MALLAVVDTGTFGAAAGELGYTQSAVSQQIASLERAVGATLLVRPGGPRRVSLTPIGAALVVHARAVAARLLAAQADITRLRAGEREPLRVATMQSIGTKVLPQLLLRFRAEAPDITLLPSEIHDHSTLAPGVESGVFDLAFVELPVPEGPFAVRRVLDDPFVLLTPRDAPEAGSASVTMRHVARLPLIGFNDPVIDRELLAQLRRTGHEPEFVFRSDDNPTVQAFVAAGLGYALMPRLTVDEDDPQVSVIPSVTGIAPRNLALIWHVDRLLPDTAYRLVDLAVEVGEGISAAWAATD